MLTGVAAQEAGGGRRAGPAWTPDGAAGSRELARTIELMGARRRFKRKAEVYGAKESADYFYQVVSGMVRAYKVSVDGRRQVGAFYVPGDVFGLETGDRHVFSAEAVTDAAILVI